MEGGAVDDLGVVQPWYVGNGGLSARREDEHVRLDLVDQRRIDLTAQLHVHTQLGELCLVVADEIHEALPLVVLDHRGDREQAAQLSAFLIDE